MKAFGPDYWSEQYTEPETIDGMANVKDHSAYLKAFFNLEGVDIDSVIDFGFGHGKLFKEIVRTFKPIGAVGLEPSETVFKRFKPVPPIRVRQQGILEWARAPQSIGPKVFDLGVCTSVFQYLPATELREVVPIMAKRVRYLYLTVPTDVEYRRQKTELQFSDPWAYTNRTRQWYHRLLRPHFTFLSTRILESKEHFDENNTPFNDLLFRF